MAAIVEDHRCGRTYALKSLLGLAASAIMTASCTSPSYLMAAMEASQGGDHKAAVSLAQKEVARLSTPEQCSRTTNYNCGTLALAYSSLAEYQILRGDKMAGERSFRSAKELLGWTDPANRASATAMVYRDVSEAFWKVGDRARAVAIFKEGRASGGDGWLFMSSAARAADQAPSASRQPDRQDHGEQDLDDGHARAGVPHVKARTAAATSAKSSSSW
jgi:hypothetical protein